MYEFRDLKKKKKKALELMKHQVQKATKIVIGRSKRDTERKKNNYYYDQTMRFGWLLSEN